MQIWTVSALPCLRVFGTHATEIFSDGVASQTRLFASNWRITFDWTLEGIHGGQKVTEISPLLRHRFTGTLPEGEPQSSVQRSGEALSILDDWSRTPTLCTQPIHSVDRFTSAGPWVPHGKVEELRPKVSSCDRMRFEILLTRLTNTSLYL